MFSLKTIAQITNGVIYGIQEKHIDSFVTDSRQRSFSNQALFVALVTDRNNGHHYIESLQEQIACFLVSELPNKEITSLNTHSYIVVKDTLKALQQIAAYHREQFSIPIIGITGSNGKTVVKEWLFQLLNETETICRSPKSFNSQLGVPLSVLKLETNHTLGIFEAGISKSNEMGNLQSIIQPTIGVLTSLGDAHSEGFKTIEEKLTEKLKLLTTCEKIIINGVEKTNLPISIRNKAICINTSENADVHLSYTLEKTKTHIHLKTHTKQFSFYIPFIDKASIYNAASCAVVLLEMNYNLTDFEKRFLNLQALALRLEVKTGIQQSMIINDFYNSDLDSIQIALDFLNQQHRKEKKIAIISDIEQSSKNKNELYLSLQSLLQKTGIDILIGIGKDISAHQKLFNTTALFFENTSDFVLNYTKHLSLFHNSSILLKGARSFGFERISNVLQLKSHDTVLEINLNNLTQNINYYKSLIKTPTQLMCMVKATAYGSGSTEIAATLQHIGVNYLAVAYADEGVELREANITLPIMVMSPEKDAWTDIITFQLEPEIYSFTILNQLIEQLELAQVTEPFPIHIKVDTGMHRLGFESNELSDLLEKIKSTKLIKVQSVFSHLVASDNKDLDAFTQHQIQTFTAFFTQLENELGYKVLKHICNSGGISRFSHAHFDMVRLGIGMYGVGVSASEQAQLQNVSKLKTTISQIKNVSAGDTVGYNRNGKATKATRIATIPVGYADGFLRTLGNGKHSVFINGEACKTIGNICMDMCMIDITEVNCEEGDEVIIFETNSQLQNLAQSLQTIAYEVLTGISARVKRVYVQE
jgi:Alr-MurF fusion protein